MQVQVKVQEGVQWYHYVSAFQLVVPEGTNLGTFLALLGVDMTDAIAGINGGVSGPETVLADGDQILIQERGDRHGSVSDRSGSGIPDRGRRGHEGGGGRAACPR